MKEFLTKPRHTTKDYYEKKTVCNGLAGAALTQETKLRLSIHNSTHNHIEPFLLPFWCGNVVQSSIIEETKDNLITLLGKKATGCCVPNFLGQDLAAAFLKYRIFLVSRLPHPSIIGILVFVPHKQILMLWSCLVFFTFSNLSVPLQTYAVPLIDQSYLLILTMMMILIWWWGK